MSLLRRLGRPTPSPIPRRSLTPSRPFSESAAAHPSSKTQLYISHSRDPLINLSLEHRLLQTSHADSTILLLYANRPCVVFGRNQNPWIEADLDALGARGIQLVRRRSGGGTVFHDEGNVNFSVICPPAVFDRDRHAEMVVRALQKLGRPTTRVNERHDIVMDVQVRDGSAAAPTTRTFKVSGSAYKLTRLRSLHHGTCLLRSPNLGRISALLRSPAEPFVQARGVDSVRSPVANVDVDPEAFRAAVVDEFKAMYVPGGGALDVCEEVGGGGSEGEALLLGNDGVRRGYEELASRAWVYGQTPRFTFSTRPTDEDPRERPALPFDVSHYHHHPDTHVESPSLNQGGNPHSHRSTLKPRGESWRSAASTASRRTRRL